MPVYVSQYVYVSHLYLTYSDDCVEILLWITQIVIVKA